MNTRKIEGRELEGRLTAFAACRILARTAALGLMVAIGSTFLSGCTARPTEKKMNAEEPAAVRNIIPKFRVVPGINEADIAVWTEANASGAHALVMTERAYKSISDASLTTSPTSPDAYETFTTMQKLETGCRKLAPMPADLIEPETGRPEDVAGLSIIARTFLRARADYIRAAQAGQKVLLRANPEAQKKISYGISGKISATHNREIIDSTPGGTTPAPGLTPKF